MNRKLDDTELATAVTTLPNWKLEGGELIRCAIFNDFKEAMDFVNRVATLAEAANHHPDIDIRYNRVRLALVTHDSGGITLLDVELAGGIEGEFKKMGGGGHGG